MDGGGLASNGGDGSSSPSFRLREEVEVQLHLGRDKWKKGMICDINVQGCGGKKLFMIFTDEKQLVVEACRLRRGEV